MGIFFELRQISKQNTGICWIWVVTTFRKRTCHTESHCLRQASQSIKIWKPIALQSLLPMSIPCLQFTRSIHTMATMVNLEQRMLHFLYWNNKSRSNGSKSFSLLLEEQFVPVPLLEAEDDRLKAEYTILTSFEFTQSHQRLPLTSYGIPSSLRKDIANTACLSTILPSTSLPDRSMNLW